MFKKITLMLVLSLVFLYSKEVLAAPGDPVMIIRFQRPNVDYKKSLKMLVKKAKEINTEIQFKIISVLPKASETEEFQTKQESARNLNEIVSEIQSAGINPSNIKASFQENSKISSNIVYIYAE